jgi:hypothetical protein
MLSWPTKEVPQQSLRLEFCSCVQITAFAWMTVPGFMAQTVTSRALWSGRLSIAVLIQFDLTSSEPA